MKVKRTKKWALDFFENKKGKIEFSPKSLTISWGILGGGGAVKFAYHSVFLDVRGRTFKKSRSEL